MNNETGGPAFPFAFTDEGRVSDGMTLRDYFAAKAMQGCCAFGNGSLSGDGSADAVARWAYALADAMLKARDEK